MANDKRSHVTTNPELIAWKCLALLGDSDALRRLDSAVEASARKILDDAVTTHKNAFENCVNYYGFSQIRTNDGKYHSLRPDQANARIAIEKYIHNPGNMAGQEKKYITQARETYNLILVRLDQEEQRITRRLSESSLERIEKTHWDYKKALTKANIRSHFGQPLSDDIAGLLIEFYEIRSAMHYAATAKSQLDAFLNKLSHSRPSHATGNVPEDREVVALKCLSALGSMHHIKQLEEYKNPRLSDIPDETRQQRTRLLQEFRSPDDACRHEITVRRKSGASVFTADVGEETKTAIEIVEKFYEGRLPSLNERERLARVRDMYNAMGTALDRKYKKENYDLPAEVAANIRYAGTVASAIETVLQYIETGERKDLCNQCLAAMGDEWAAGEIAASARLDVRATADGIQTSLSNFKEKLKVEKLKLSLPEKVPDIIRSVRDKGRTISDQELAQIELAKRIYQSLDDELRTRSQHPEDESLAAAADFAGMTAKLLNTMTDELTQEIKTARLAADRETAARTR